MRKVLVPHQGYATNPATHCHGTRGLVSGSKDAIHLHGHGSPWDVGRDLSKSPLRDFGRQLLDRSLQPPMAYASK